MDSATALFDQRLALSALLNDVVAKVVLSSLPGQQVAVALVIRPSVGARANDRISGPSLILQPRLQDSQVAVTTTRHLSRESSGNCPLVQPCNVRLIRLLSVCILQES